MSVAPILIGERIEDAVLPRPHFDGVPTDRPRLALRQRLRRLQEFLDFFLFTGLSLQLRPNRKSSHDVCSSFPSDAGPTHLVARRFAPPPKCDRSRMTSP